MHYDLNVTSLLWTKTAHVLSTDLHVFMRLLVEVTAYLTLLQAPL